MGWCLTVARKRAANQRSLAYTLKIIQHGKETSVRCDSRVCLLISVPRWDIFIRDNIQSSIKQESWVSTDTEKKKKSEKRKL